MKHMSSKVSVADEIWQTLIIKRHNSFKSEIKNSLVLVNIQMEGTSLLILPEEPYSYRGTFMFFLSFLYISFKYSDKLVLSWIPKSILEKKMSCY